jgi:hypothetical protein
VTFKYLIILMLVLIIGSLGKALFHLSQRTPGDSRKMVNALTWRIGLSVGLFVLLMLAYYEGWITPQAGRPQAGRERGAAPQSQ